MAPVLSPRHDVATKPGWAVAIAGRVTRLIAKEDAARRAAGNQEGPGHE